MVRVALVGLGFMGKTHLGIYQRLPTVQVAAICDARKENLEITRLDGGGNIQTSSGAIDLSGARKYTDYAGMLADGGFDFVDICLPTFLHADYTIRALQAGYHVLCEKPMALTTSETKKMLEAVERSGKLFSVGQCLRFWPPYVEVKKLIDSGRYGKTLYAEFARYSAPAKWSWGGWINDGALSGNAALDLHIHDVDMILYLFGKPDTVRSNGLFAKDGTILHIATIYTYQDQVVQASGGWVCSDSFGFNMRAFYVLESATVDLDFSKSPLVTVYPSGGDKYALPLPDGDGYLYELKDFAQSVEQGKSSGIVTGQSAADAVALCLLEIESAKKKKEKPFR
jgi:predicted dehydrogenase